jgi:hypothetical protein
MSPFLISIICGIIIGSISACLWVNDALAVFHLVWFIPTLLIILYVAGKRNKIFLIMKILLLAAIAILSAVLFIYLNLWRGDIAIAEFECAYTNVQLGMAKSDVLQIMGKYVVSDQDRRVVFRSLPKEPKTHFCIKDAHVDLDDDGKVVEKIGLYLVD